MSNYSEKIRAELQGIEDDETNNGWWSGFMGAKFGRGKLQAVVKITDQADTREHDLSCQVIELQQENDRLKAGYLHLLNEATDMYNSL